MFFQIISVPSDKNNGNAHQTYTLSIKYHTYQFYHKFKSIGMSYQWLICLDEHKNIIRKEISSTIFYFLRFFCYRYVRIRMHVSYEAFLTHGKTRNGKLEIKENALDIAQEFLV